MKLVNFLHYWATMTVAAIVFPALKITGFRFGKKWRGNPFVSHVAANLWADGQSVGFCKFFNSKI